MSAQTIGWRALVPPKKSARASRIFLILEDRRMARVSDEVTDVRPRRKLAGVSRGRIERNYQRPTPKLRDGLARDRAERAVWQRQNDDICSRQAFLRRDCVQAACCQVLKSSVADLRAIQGIRGIMH